MKAEKMKAFIIIQMFSDGGREGCNQRFWTFDFPFFFFFSLAKSTKIETLHIELTLKRKYG